jgi:hypothetical protein
MVSKKNTGGSIYIHRSTAGRLQQFEYSLHRKLFIGFKEALGYRESEKKQTFR